MSEKVAFALRFLLFATTHSLFATARVKKILNGAESKGYRLTYNIASLAMFGWVMSAHRHSEVLYVAPGVWSLVMYALQLVVIVTLLACLAQTGIANFLGFSKQISSQFISTGLYSIARHPLYFFSILFMALNPVMTSQWLILTIISTVYFIIGGIVEERRLIAAFGDEYVRYQHSVPFLVPKFFKSKLSEL